MDCLPLLIIGCFTVFAVSLYYSFSDSDLHWSLDVVGGQIEADEFSEEKVSCYNHKALQCAFINHNWPPSTVVGSQEGKTT